MTIELPCDIGDTAYYVRFDKDGRGWFTAYRVVGIHIAERKRGRAIREKREDYLVCATSPVERVTHFPLREIGTKLFFSEKEAEETAKRGLTNMRGE